MYKHTFIWNILWNFPETGWNINF